MELPKRLINRPFSIGEMGRYGDIDPVYWKGSNYSFGGVFLPGIIGGYDYPIYITRPSKSSSQKDVHQNSVSMNVLSISIYDDQSATQIYVLHHVGGSDLLFFSDSARQKEFMICHFIKQKWWNFLSMADISTFQEICWWELYIPEIIVRSSKPNSWRIGLLVSSIHSISERSLLFRQDDWSGIVRWVKLQVGEKYLAVILENRGSAPLPEIPNKGTWPSNSMLQFMFTKTPSVHPF